MHLVAILSTLNSIADKNECHFNNGGCNQTCTNTEGSFECSCNEGYTLADDDLDCAGKFISGSMQGHSQGVH